MVNALLLRNIASFAAVLSALLAALPAAAQGGAGPRWFLVRGSAFAGDLHPRLRNAPLRRAHGSEPAYLEMAQPGISQLIVPFEVGPGFRPRFVLLDMHTEGGVAHLSLEVNGEKLIGYQFSGFTEYVTNGFEIGEHLKEGPNEFRLRLEGLQGGILHVRGLVLSRTSSLLETLESMPSGLPPWFQTASTVCGALVGILLIWVALHRKLRALMRSRPLLFGTLGITIALLGTVFAYALLPGLLPIAAGFAAVIAAVVALAFPVARKPAGGVTGGR